MSCFYSSRATTRIALLSLTFVSLASTARCADYFLGTSAAAQGGVALANIGELNARSLQPGDRVFFAGGESFTGTILLGPDDAGTREAPVELTSYGPGRALINAGAGAGIQITNAAGFSIHRLDLTGAGAATSKATGLEVGAYTSRDVQFEFLRFHDLKISGFFNGVLIWGWYTGNTPAWCGFRDVKLTSLEVFDNCNDGIASWGTWLADGLGTKFSHANFYVADCLVYGNKGNPTSSSHTGNGIVISGVKDGVIERCVAHDNGGRGPATGGGPFGIWVWEVNGFTLQHNLVYNQKTSSMLDGGAYDLDGGSANCVVQYNYSYNNEGPAVGIIQFSNASPLVNNVVRYNVSENDSRKTGQGVLFIGEYSEPYGIKGAEVYGNTFYIGATPSGYQPEAVTVMAHDDIAGIRIRNNIFQATHSSPLLSGTTNSAKVLYQGNNYWGGTINLTNLRAAGHETLAGKPIGTRIDPRLQAPGQGGPITTIAELRAIQAYRLRADSPMIGAALDLLALFNVDPGATDFFGVPIASSAADVGAAEFVPPQVVVEPPVVIEPPVVTEPPPPVVTEPPQPPATPEPEVPAPEPTPLTIVHDTFSGTGSLAGRTPDTSTTASARWQVETGSITLANGLASTNNSARAVIASALSDCTVEGAVVLTTGGTGLILRSSDSANYLRLTLASSGITLAKTAAGVTTTLKTVSTPLKLGTTLIVTATLAGDDVTISVDGAVLMKTATTFNRAATRHGLLASATGTRHWDSFKIIPLAATVP